ncbi:MAG: hypothetical protein AUJ01_06190 [Acidobacteria bacterium 13_1_40CM_3_65_5]|nr:MAG: hypothetical protein AUJ01_06190 [Acidobacteria bacterium 13_1_40CM_3_65_5]OLE81591.1 MAG: hypothetical protein AUF76_12605 [Acidobacteria bacterium 13_1_20CM_2_65_9]
MRHARHRVVKHVKRWIWVSTSIIAAVVILIVLFAATVPLSSNTLRHRIIQTLSKRLNADVELGDLSLRVYPRLRVEGANLAIRKRGRTDVPPLISIKTFHADADLAGLMHKHVAHVQLDGLDIEVPPSDHDGDNDDKDEKAKGRASEHKAHIEDGVVIDTLDANGAKLLIIPRSTNKKPKEWDIHTLRMHNVGANQAMPYDATLTNAIPPGEIKTSGSFGPWVTDDEGKTPLEGKFTFKDADLSVFHGISGILASKGTFGGSLEWIDINGETDTPNFTIKVSGHPFPLHTKYHSVVDGTNGDTRLERIDASFLESSLVAKGAVLDEPGHVKGRLVTLDIDMERARIEDVMLMAVKATKPPMTGALKLVTKFVLPPGESDVSERLRLDGRFTIAGARFTNYDVQGKIMELSHRGRGQSPEAAKASVTSSFAGRFRLADGVLALPEVSFDVPGAKVQLAGQYSLKQETIDFKGMLLLDAKISETTTGVKSLLLKVVDPLFTKEGGGSAIPIKIEGTRNDPKFGLDVGRVFKKGDKT